MCENVWDNCTKTLFWTIAGFILSFYFLHRKALEDNEIIPLRFHLKVFLDEGVVTRITTDKLRFMDIFSDNSNDKYLIKGNSYSKILTQTHDIFSDCVTTLYFNPEHNKVFSTFAPVNPSFFASKRNVSVHSLTTTYIPNYDLNHLDYNLYKVQYAKDFKIDMCNCIHQVISCPTSSKLAQIATCYNVFKKKEDNEVYKMVEVKQYLFKNKNNEVKFLKNFTKLFNFYPQYKYYNVNFLTC
jgi:hypothetical protein